MKKITKPTKEQVKAGAVKTVTATVMTGQSIVAGKLISDSLKKKNKKKAIAIGGVSTAANIALLLSEAKIEQKIVDAKFGKKKEEPKTDVTNNSQPE